MALTASMLSVFASKPQTVIPSASGQYNFMIAQITDTQAFFWSTCASTNSSQVVDMYQWIFSHHDPSCSAEQKNGKGCYKYIFYVGDIVDGNSDPGMWAKAGMTFAQIAGQNKNRIPLGFTAGNHDYASKDGGAGNGVYQSPNDDSAQIFLSTIYQQQGSYAPRRISSASPFLTDTRFTVDNVKFIALNVPYGLPTSPTELQAGHAA